MSDEGHVNPLHTDVDPPTIELNNVDLKEATDGATNGAIASAAKWSGNGAAASSSSGAAVVATSTNDDSHDDHEHVINLFYS